MLPIDRGALIKSPVRLLEMSGPSGHTAEAMAVVEGAPGRLGLMHRRTRDGGAACEVPGVSVERGQFQLQSAPGRADGEGAADRRTHAHVTCARPLRRLSRLKPAVAPPTLAVARGAR